MAVSTPFTHDPSQTEAFRILDYEAQDEEFRDLKVVVIGGGTGAPVSIRTLLSMGLSTSAVVAMADDGGSTGILRQEADVTPPGDVRKCIAAMAADPQDPLTRAFKYRFAFARNHTLGNLMLSALENATHSFPEAIKICEELLHARGHVYPSTLNRVSLFATTRDGRRIEGQAVACHSRTALETVTLESNGPIKAYEPALQAIREADLIVLGPGSLFTSIIPNLLVPGVVEAIEASAGATVFVCSLADMQGETWGLTAKEHVEALLDHGMRGLLDYVLIHSKETLHAERLAEEVFPEGSTGEEDTIIASGFSELEMDARIRPVRVTYQDVRSIQDQGPCVLLRNLIDPIHPTWHNPQALREAFQGVIRLCRSRQK